VQLNFHWLYYFVSTFKVQSHWPRLCRDRIHHLLCRQCDTDRQSWQQLALHAIEHIPYTHPTHFRLPS
jgi:hypothetical protein